MAYDKLLQNAESLTSVEVSILREIIDKTKIYDNMVQYCRGLDRFDIELLKASFWPEATDDHGAWVGSAWGFCERTVSRKYMFKNVSHHIGNTQTQIIGDQAKVETYFFCVINYINPDGNGDICYFLGGRYKDLYERRGDEWKVLRRVCLWDWNQDQPDLSNWARGGIPAPNNFGKPAPDDPIYGQW